MSIIKANTIENVAGTETHDVATMGIEHGSNAHGYYTKFPDGTLICTFSVSGSTGGEVTWTFPVPVVSTLNLALTGAAKTSGTYGISVVFKIPSNTSVQFSAYNSSDARIANGLGLMLVGRWK